MKTRIDFVTNSSSSSYVFRTERGGTRDEVFRTMRGLYAEYINKLKRWREMTAEQWELHDKEVKRLRMFADRFAYMDNDDLCDWDPSEQCDTYERFQSEVVKALTDLETWTALDTYDEFSRFAAANEEPYLGKRAFVIADICEADRNGDEAARQALLTFMRTALVPPWVCADCPRGESVNFCGQFKYCERVERFFKEPLTLYKCGMDCDSCAHSVPNVKRELQARLYHDLTPRYIMQHRGAACIKPRLEIMERINNGDIVTLEDAVLAMIGGIAVFSYGDLLPRCVVRGLNELTEFHSDHL